MIRRAFLKRMAFAALASGLLGSELLRRAPRVEGVWTETQWSAAMQRAYVEAWNKFVAGERARILHGTPGESSRGLLDIVS